MTALGSKRTQDASNISFLGCGSKVNCSLRDYTNIPSIYSNMVRLGIRVYSRTSCIRDLCPFAQVMPLCDVR